VLTPALTVEIRQMIDRKLADLQQGAINAVQVIAWGESDGAAMCVWSIKMTQLVHTIRHVTSYNAWSLHVSSRGN